MINNVKEALFIKISEEILKNFGVETFLKGSYGYNSASEVSDYDIQIDAKEYLTFTRIAEHYNAKLRSIIFQNSIGDKYRSTIASFYKQGKEINLIFDEHPKAWNMVKEVTMKIRSLRKDERYVIRLISGSLKYDRLDAVDILLKIYKANKHSIDGRLIKLLEEGEMLEQEEAVRIRDIFQSLYCQKVRLNFKIS